MKFVRVGSKQFWICAEIALASVVFCGCKSDSSGSDSSKRNNSSLSLEQSHHAMVKHLSEIATASKTEGVYFGNGRREQLLHQVEGSQGKATARMLLALGDTELNLGMEREAIVHFEQALSAVKEEGEQGVQRSDVLYWLGVGNLRLAETENCCARNTPDSCILPIRGEGIHIHKNGSRKAIEYFSEVLQTTLSKSETHVRARWLLNIATMTLGEYPSRVPQSYRVDPDYFTSEVAFPQFKNISKKLGLNTFSCAGGAIVDDFDNDGDFDVAVSDSDPGGQLYFYRNRGEEGFVDETEAAHLMGILGGLNMVHTDFNNDGWLDIFVLRGGWFKGDGRHPNSLLRNNRDGTFTDITLRAGLAEVNYPTQTASWGDYDLDGDLDLYIGNERHSKDPPSQLFRNNGDETFTDVAREAGVTNTRFAKAVIWGDYDGDRYPDLYVSNFGAKNRLYHNNGDGTFTDQAEELGVDGPKVSFPCWFWDMDNDGLLDLFVSSYAAKMDDVAADAMKFTLNIEKARLYKNTGKNFKDVASEMGVTRPSSPMGSNFGDINGDGYLDFYLGTGWPDYDELMPNQMFVNRGGREFVDVTMASGLGHLQKGHAIVFADLDQDGDQDILEEMGGAFPGDRYYNACFENPGFGKNWIAIKLAGTKTNRAAIGARIHIEIEQDGVTRSIYRHVNSGGTFGGNPFQQNIGLGKVEKIRLLEIEWPVSNEKQQFRNLDVNQTISITEGADEITSIPRK
jgi:hypothetical protein